MRGPRTCWPAPESPSAGARSWCRRPTDSASRSSPTDGVREMRHTPRSDWSHLSCNRCLAKRSALWLLTVRLSPIGCVERATRAIAEHPGVVADQGLGRVLDRTVDGVRRLEQFLERFDHTAQRLAILDLAAVTGPMPPRVRDEIEPCLVVA